MANQPKYFENYFKNQIFSTVLLMKIHWSSIIVLKLPRFNSDLSFRNDFIGKNGQMIILFL